MTRTMNCIRHGSHPCGHLAAGIDPVATMNQRDTAESLSFLRKQVPVRVLGARSGQTAPRGRTRAADVDQNPETVFLYGFTCPPRGY